MNSRRLFEYDIKYTTSPQVSHLNGKLGVNIVGTDEAGRGPGAGDVFSAAVYRPVINEDLIKDLSKLDDSKKLSDKIREELYDVIIKNSVWSVCQGSVEQIEKTDILSVSLWTMKIACEDVIKKSNIDNPFVLVDGNKLIRNFDYNQKWIKKGDGTSASVAAASIIAKVTRDRYMNELDSEFPQYDWKSNKGYLTKAHLEAVDKYGLTKYHRKSFFTNHFQKQMALPF